MVNVDEIILEIADLIRREKLEIFAGAGISFKSGIPMAIPIMEYILEKLGLSNEDIKIVKDSKLPFEAFMEVIIGHLDLSLIDRFIKIFKVGHPNKNHQLISKLSKAKNLKKIFTTNFDTLFEQALSAEKLVFNVKKNVDELTQELDPQKIEVIKLHGCVTDPTSLAILLRQVANKFISENRRTAIEMAFKNTESTALLVMGYSFSDVFDIMPIVSNIQEENKKLYIIEHQFDNKEEVIPITNNLPFLGNYKGYRLLINTDIFIKKLWKLSLDENCQFQEIQSPNFNSWKSIIDEWANEALNNSGYNSYMLGKIFTAIGQNQLSQKWFLDGIAKNYKHDELLSAKLNQALAIVYRNSAAYEKSIKHGQIALSIGERRNDIAGMASCRTAIADSLRNLGRLEDALSIAQEALDISENAKNIHMMLPQLNSIGLIYMEMDRYDDAVKFFERANEVNEKIGDIYAEAYTLGNIALVKKKKGNLEEAAKLYKRVIEIAKQLGDLKLLFTNNNNLAAISEPQEALELYESNLKISEATNDSYRIGIAQYNLAVKYLDVGRRQDFIRAAKRGYMLLRPMLPPQHILIKNLEGLLQFTQ